MKKVGGFTVIDFGGWVEIYYLKNESLMFISIKEGLHLWIGSDSWDVDFLGRPIIDGVDEI